MIDNNEVVLNGMTLDESRKCINGSLNDLFSCHFTDVNDDNSMGMMNGEPGDIAKVVVKG